MTAQLVAVFTAEGAARLGLRQRAREIAEIQLTCRFVCLARAEICLYFSAHFAFSAVIICLYYELEHLVKPPPEISALGAVAAQVKRSPVGVGGRLALARST